MRYVVYETTYYAPKKKSPWPAIIVVGILIIAGISSSNDDKKKADAERQKTAQHLTVDGPPAPDRDVTATSSDTTGSRGN